ncbi:MAG: hypothetical protein IJX17_06520 [Clostridia bacterium]|nr:hypothetical protein [Clostridia bacterium]
MSDKQPTKKEQRQEKVNEIVKVSKELKTVINQSVIDDELKAQILPLIEEIEVLCKAHAEALRLSQVVILYDLKTEKQRGFFKSLYLKEINKIFN